MREVSPDDKRVVKPRTLFWERLLLSGESSLRVFLDHAAKSDELGEGAFSFLPRLKFHADEVEHVGLVPLPRLDEERERELAAIVGRSVALFTWLGAADLHWENLALGLDHEGRIVFAPLDIEMLLADLSLPTETKLVADADPEVADVCRHAAGLRRVLPFLGKPVAIADLLAIVSAYGATLRFLDRHAKDIAKILSEISGLREAPLRVLLRGTDEYVRALTPSARADLWPPLLGEELAQMDRGDIPYFFRLYGQPGIHAFANEELTERLTLPRDGDVPQLDPMLSIEKHLRSPTRKRLREEGVFVLIGAFDDASFEGTHTNGAVEIVFKRRSIRVTFANGEELETRRDMRAFVGSLYLPCTCGEVRSVLVPKRTRCDASRLTRTRTKSVVRKRKP